MRVIAGVAKGTRLKTAPGRWLRPTSDRARTVLFDWLAGRTVGARVLDLFCGTGALGIEALSRGAERATFVDVRTQAVRLTSANLEAAGLLDQAEILRADVRSFLARAVREGRQYDLIFADPPYGRRQLLQSLLVQVEGVLDPAGVFVLEHSRRTELPEELGALRLTEGRVVGETAFTIFQREGTSFAA